MTAQNKPAAAKLTPSAAHRRAAKAFLDSLDGVFRRSTLSKVMYPLTNPRSRPLADQLAEVLIRGLSKNGRIQRHGHLHWIKVSQSRTLMSGRTVPELDAITRLPLSTHCPGKWLSLDLETGEVWAGNQSGCWRLATPDERSEARACLEETAKYGAKKSA